MLTIRNKIFHTIIHPQRHRILTRLVLCLTLTLSAITLQAQEDVDEIADTTAIVLADTLREAVNDTLPWPLSMQTRIDSIIANASLLKTTNVGLLIYDLTADSVLYDLDSKKTLRPASTMKVITAITALDKLGGAYQYKTVLKYTGHIVDSTRTLHGDIYLIGGLDPKLGSDDLRAFASAIKDLGVDTIRGNIYADKSMKDEDLLGEGWCWDDDNPVLSALVYGRKDNILDSFTSILCNTGIYLDGETSDKICPRSGTHTLITRTHTIEQILHRMQQKSDNLYAETKIYQIGLTQGSPSTARKARSVMEALLRKIGLGKVPHRFADGSGLSLYNYVSAEIEVAFLRYAYANADILAYFKPALPEAAVDGTLQKRMHGTAAAHNVHAKTGTLEGVSALAGYCTASNGHELCFSIINSGGMKSTPTHNFQDRICVAMCQ